MKRTLFVNAASLALFGTIALAQNVTYDFDRTVNFSRFKTYSWVRGTNLTDELNHKRVVNAIDSQLVSKGMTKIDAGASPDLLVAYHATFDKDLQITGFSSGWGGYRFAANRTGTARAEEILVGTLAVDLVDATSKTIVWRGFATKEIDVKAAPEKRDKNINARGAEAVQELSPGEVTPLRRGHQMMTTTTHVTSSRGDLPRPAHSGR